MTSQLTYLIAQQHTEELQQAAAQRRLVREARTQRPRTTSPRVIARVATQSASRARVMLTPRKGL